MYSKQLIVLLGVLLSLQGVSNSFGDDDLVQEKRHARMRKLAESIQVFADDDGKQLAKLHADPIFVWSNPQREAVGGMAFLWTHRGRPHATIGIWTYDDTASTDSYELQSLADQSFRTNQTIWPTGQKGLEYRKLETKLKPAGKKLVRLIQMRQLVRKNFSATLTLQSKRVEKLRFLPAPVFRYDELPPNVMDGAVFSFAQGTDPEVFVILEAREVGGVHSWHYAIASQSSATTKASLGDRVIWDSDISHATFRMVMRKP